MPTQANSNPTLEAFEGMLFLQTIVVLMSSKRRILNSWSLDFYLLTRGIHCTDLCLLSQIPQRYLDTQNTRELLPSCTSSLTDVEQVWVIWYTRPSQTFIVTKAD